MIAFPKHCGHSTYNHGGLALTLVTSVIVDCISYPNTLAGTVLASGMCVLVAVCV